jgi:hypothetical protein
MMSNMEPIIHHEARQSIKWRSEFAVLKEEKEIPAYHFDTLRKNYLYKGPIVYCMPKLR